MAGYIGPIPVPQATQTRETFTATASQTTFNTAGYQPGYLDVFMNGVKLIDGSDYTATNGSDVVLSSGAAVNDLIEVVAYTAFEVLNQNFTGTTTVADLTVTGDLTVDGTTTTINSTTLNVDDINITVASGAADAAAANGAGLTVDGANATFNYASSGDKWTMNKDLDITGGLYTDGIVNIQKADGTFIQTVGTSNNTGYINWESNGWTFYTNGPLEALRIGSSELVINEDSRDYDFRVESNSQEHMLFVDANNNRFGVRESSPSAALHVTSSDGGNYASIIEHSAATNPNGLKIEYSGSGDTNTYAFIVKNTARDILDVRGTGSFYHRAYDGGAIIFNNGSNDVDFVVRGDTNNNLLYVDGGNGALAFGNSVNTGQYAGTGNNGMGVNLVGQAGQYVTVQNETDANIYLTKKSGYTDGRFIQFTQNNTTVGQITSASAGTIFDVTASNNSLRLTGGSSSYWLTGAGIYAGNSATRDLGTSTYKWRDLYLSGGVYLGGTGSANKLDDYEEGTWLPQVEFTTVGSTATTSTNTYTTGGYTKIGKAVTVEFNISQISWGNGTGNVRLTGLPFTPSGVPNYPGRSVASSGHLVSATTGSSYVDILKIYGVGTYNLMASTGSGSWINVTDSNRSTINPNSINGSFTYYTNS
jgi:hypothetical protein